MADKQSEQESGQELTRSLGSARPCAGRAETESTPDHVTSAGTCQAAASYDSAGPAGCAVPSRSERIIFDNQIFSIARRSHPVQLVLAGEIDFPSLPHLTAALLDAADGCSVLHVDLADVHFCDLAALRTIIGLGQHSEDQQPPRRASSVVLHNVPIHVEKVMRILGWDTTPGLTIDTGRTSTQKPGNTPPAQMTPSPKQTQPRARDQQPSPEAP